MAIDFKKTQLSGHTPEIWRGECKILPGGFKPVQNFPVGTVLHRGTPIYVDFEAMSAAVCKTAKVLKGGTTTAPRVAKGALLRRRRRSNETRSNRQIPDHQVHRHGQCRVRCHHVRIRHRRAGRGRHPRRGNRICRNRRRFGFRPHPCRASLYTQHGCRSGQGVHRKGPPDD